MNGDKKTVIRMLEMAGKKALEIHDTLVNNVKSNLVQCDEVWAYVGKKQKQLDLEQRYYSDKNELGDQYTFVAMDAETKLVINFLIGKRTYENTISFIRDMNARIMTRFQLTTDSFQPYYNAVKRTFGNEIDYAQIHKVFNEPENAEKRYSPAQIKKIQIIPLIGEPKLHHVSTSYIERQNLTMRMQMRRFTRLTNAFSKKLENLKYAVALHFFYYNFIRVHKTLRATPAMKAGIANSFWTWEMFLGFENEYKKVA